LRIVSINYTRLDPFNKLLADAIPEPGCVSSNKDLKVTIIDADKYY